MDLTDYCKNLEKESLLSVSNTGGKDDGEYKTKHPRWDLEFFSFLLHAEDARTLRTRKLLLKSIINSLFKIKNQEITRSIISGLYDLALLDTEDNKKIPIEVIENILEMPVYLSKETKCDLFTFSRGYCYFHLGNTTRL